MDPLAVLAYGAEHASPLIGMEWNGMEDRRSTVVLRNIAALRCGM